jgi:hypothetical protein
MADFSCYVTIDNRNGDYELYRDGYAHADWGGYDHSYPAEKIGFEESSFRLNDHAGPAGSEGWVRYTYTTARGIKKAFKFSYADPYSGDNYCSGANFYTKSGDGNWGGLNEIQTSGHPFYVKFVL